MQITINRFLRTIISNLRGARIKKAKIDIFDVSDPKIIFDFLRFRYEDYIEKEENVLLDIRAQRKRGSLSALVSLSFGFFVGDNVYIPHTGFWTVGISSTLLPTISSVISLAQQLLLGKTIQLYVMQTVIVPYIEGIDNITANNIISDLENYIKEELTKLLDRLNIEYQIEIFMTNCGEGYWEETQTAYYGCDLEIIITANF